MKKIIISLLALLAIATTAAAATDYGIWVGGVKVTSDNAKNITGGDINQGTITYDPEKKSLVLRNVTITRSGSGKNAIHNEKCEGLLIAFYGTNNLSTSGASTIKIEKKSTIRIPKEAKLNLLQKGSGDEGIYIVSSDLTIDGKGDLYISSYDTGIEGKNATESLTIEDTNVEIKSTRDCLVDFANVTFKGGGTTKLAPMNTSTTVKRVGNVKSMTFEGYQHIVEPLNAYFNSSDKTIVQGSNPITNQTIVINADVIMLTDNSKISDANFRKYLKETFAKGKDYLLLGEAKKITTMKMDYREIETLKGIEYFTGLTSLTCNKNKLTSIDLSKNTALTGLYCNENSLTELDVSKNTDLLFLLCDDNKLTTLDVSKNTKLRDLHCRNNQLTTLNISMNTALEELYCYGNQLTSLNVSKNTALIELSCGKNKLNTLDVSKKTKLKILWCDSNQLTSLNVSGCTALTDFCCYSNKIKDDKMQALVNGLPNVTTERKFYVIDTKDSNEQNVITKSQVKIATNKNWKVYDYKGRREEEYAGSDSTTSIETHNRETITNNDWYSIDGKKLSGEPTKKGVYIVNGRKVVK